MPRSLSDFPRTSRQLPRSRAQPLIPPPLVALSDPELSGAACTGLAPLFDDELPGESDEQREARHRDAAGICHRCPVQARCRVAATEHHALGVWSGICQPRTAQPASGRQWRETPPRPHRHREQNE